LIAEAGRLGRRGSGRGPTGVYRAAAR